MKITTSSTYLQNQPTLQILSNMAVTLNITANPLNLATEQLFQMAARVNKKRGFLFVSKVLGKHIPVHPLKPLLTSGLLAIEYYEQTTETTVPTKSAILNGILSEDTASIELSYQLLSELSLELDQDPIIIGFAETATSLGHAFFDVFTNAFYIHTTRENVSGTTSNLEFEEEHSHAVDQHCYIGRNQIENEKPVILVDDEITTGKTAINIIRTIHTTFPRKNYSVISILDWRSEENKQKFVELERELDITITSCSIVSGNMEFIGSTLDRVDYNYSPSTQSNEVNHRIVDLSLFFTQSRFVNKSKTSPYIKETGRFGINHTDRAFIKKACANAGEYLGTCRTGSKTLCLGTGEFMYLPMRISSQMGAGVKFHSTTRSPIYPQVKQDYGIQNGYRFPNPEDAEVLHYIYNIPKDEYDDIFIYFEREIEEESLRELMDICKEQGIKQVNTVIFSKENGSERIEQYSI
ncbi:phosphoribosyltransferase family protein [Bacillus sp. DJP31]|uniref:phosphoribosyltransferase family protein n=1 Tax=Bacillus sp. DJP31 TaxID=3409789 RepID=UPI003BB73855